MGDEKKVMKITIRNVQKTDNALLRHLAKQCPSLDLHTQYTYWATAYYFNKSSFILEDDGKPIGYIMALNTPDVIFIWQIGIIKEYRGKGLSCKLISAVMEYAKSINKPIEVTIASNNKSSFNAFKSAALKQNLKMIKSDEINIIDLDDDAFSENEIRYIIL